MKKSLFFLCSILCICGCQMDEDREGHVLLELLFDDERLYNYDAINENHKQPFWQEEFDNNEPKLPLSTPDVTISIEKGVLVANYFGNNRYLSEIPIVIDESLNHEIEINLLIVSSINNKNLIEFSSVGDPGYFVHGINKIYVNENKIGFKHAASNYYVFDVLCNFNNFNLITIRKIDNRAAFFINKVLFALMDNEVFSCNKTYITFNQGVNKIDYIKVSYIQ